MTSRTNMADEKSKPSSPSTPPEPDSIMLRLELEEGAISPVAVGELQQDLQDPVSSLGEASTGGPVVEQDRETLEASMGQRKMREIRLERYCSQGSDDTPIAELPDKIPFFSGIPVVEVTRGVIHLFRDRTRPVDQRSSKVVCVLAVPAHMALADLLNFLAPVHSTMKTLQVVRDSSPNQYMVLLKFINKSSAELFYTSYNGKRYNSLDKAVCQLVYASRVETKRSTEGGTLASMGLTELPNCPVCLEKLDESVLTILCNHSFHTYCITRWEDSTCPVCRYTQIPEPGGDSTCFTCDAKEDLWICLVCGHVGCGRYHGGHAHGHFVKTQHTFSMQLGSQRVWDYIGDNWVHRLVQNKSDGKLVEVSGQGEVADDEKVDSMQLEYTYLLTSQLESQRLFFEEKLVRVEQLAQEEIGQLEVRCRTAASQRETLSDQLADKEKELKAADKKISQLQAKVAKLSSELSEEKQLSKCLSDNQQQWREKINGVEERMKRVERCKEKEVKDLQDQVRDLMFYLEAQQKISQAPEDTRQELQQGHVVVTQASGDSKPPRRGRKGRMK